MKKNMLLFLGIILATGLSLAVCAVGAPRTTIGRPVDDSQAEPMCCVVMGCECVGKDVFCHGANGQTFIIRCPTSCANALCK